MKYYIVMLHGFVSRGNSETVYMNKDFRDGAKSFQSEFEAENFAKQMLKHFNINEQFYVIVRNK